MSRLQAAKNVVLRDFAIEGTAKCSMPIRLSFCKDCLVENIHFSTGVESFAGDGEPELSLVYAIYVWNTTVRGFRATLSPELLALLAAKETSYDNFSNYNLFKIISSTASGFENCHANGGTHAFNITRSASVAGGGGVPSVDCFVRDCTAANCIWAGVKIQQACYNTEVTGNTVSESAQGIISCGRKTLISGNKLSTEVPHSMDSYYTHLERGGTYGIALIEGYACGSVVKNNRVSGFHSGLAVADGYEDKNCFEEGDFLFQDNEVSHCVRGFTLYKNPHGAALGRRDLQLQILNNEFTCAPTGRAQYETASGIHLPAMSAGVTIRGNGFKQFQSGVWMAGSVDFIDIQGNRFEDCAIGLELDAIPPGSTEDPVVRVRGADHSFVRTAVPSKGMDQIQRRNF